MSNESWPRKVLLLYEGSDFGGDFDTSFLNGLEEHGCEVTCLSCGQPWSPPFDLVIGYGPFTLESGSILPVAKQLLDLPPEQRPIFAWWLTEGIPDPRFPTLFVNIASRLRLKADHLLAKGSSSPRSRWRDLVLKGHRLRVFGQLNWARELGLLDVLAVTSTSRAEYLQQRGFSPIVVPLGYHPIYGADMGLERDVEVAFLGNTLAPRRQRLLPGLFDELAKRGIKVVVENNVYGESRNKFLNRSHILLNVLRAPQDFVGQRFILGAANKALIISEPVNDSLPFIPGQHMVVASLDELPEKVDFYLSNDKKRQKIVDRAYRYATKELTITKMIGLILAQARQVRVVKEKTVIGSSS